MANITKSALMCDEGGCRFLFCEGESAANLDGKIRGRLLRTRFLLWIVATEPCGGMGDYAFRKKMCGLPSITFPPWPMDLPNDSGGSLVCPQYLMHPPGGQDTRSNYARPPAVPIPPLITTTTTTTTMPSIPHDLALQHATVL